MINNELKEAKIKRKLAKNQKVSLIGFVLLTASAIVAFYTFPSLSTAGWIAIIFAFVTAMCWFIPIGMAAAEMATVKGWTEGGIFTWVRNLIGPRAGFIVTWLQFQVTFGAVAMVLFVLSSFGFGIASTPGYNYFNTLKLGTTFNQSSSVNFSSTFNQGATYGISVAVIAFLVLLSLLGQKTTHQFGQYALIFGILAPFFIVIGFSIYTVANLDNPLYFIGRTFLKDAHLDPSATGTSYELNKAFMSSTVMASFMAFSFSLHGVEVSAIAANRMNNPSKQYPRAMMIVVSIALTCIVIGSITISMTVPTSTLSFNGGLVQTFLFNLSVGGVDVQLPNAPEVAHFKTLAHAYEVIEKTYGSQAANEVMYQFVYGEPATASQLAVGDLIAPVDPLGNLVKPSVANLIRVTNTEANSIAVKGMQVVSFFTGIGVFVEVSVWMSNLSTGLNYAMRKAHFPHWLTYRLKNGSPLTIALLWILFLMGIFAIYLYGYNSLLNYQGQTITDILANEVNKNNEPIKLTGTQLEQIRAYARSIYHSESIDYSHLNEIIKAAYRNDRNIYTPFIKYDFHYQDQSNEAVQKLFDFTEQVSGITPVASGTPASITNVGFISNVVSQISMYYIGYNIFLIGYLRFVFKHNYLRREFRIKHKFGQAILPLMAIGVNCFAVVATYLPAAPELYPGKEVYYVFVSISLPLFIAFIFVGLMIYGINYLWNKYRGINLHETPNYTNVPINVLDVVNNWHLYANKKEFMKFERHIDLLGDKIYTANNGKTYEERSLASKEAEYLAAEIATRFAPELDDH
ncbi:APC family permease [Ureaplasma canigenitalium]|uniref:APC family permease n=1 Tax=Ureaplasma canigenitalium TaxID=42092 RepID=UPI0004E0C564|nr:amino acid permease [Ureaplasma canigenitalium]